MLVQQRSMLGEIEEKFKPPSLLQQANLGWLDGFSCVTFHFPFKAKYIFKQYFMPQNATWLVRKK